MDPPVPPTIAVGNHKVGAGPSLTVDLVHGVRASWAGAQEGADNHIVRGVNTLRTPDERFATLPEFGYEPQYTQVPDQDGGSLRMAWVEDGPPDGEPVLLL